MLDFVKEFSASIEMIKGIVKVNKQLITMLSRLWGKPNLHSLLEEAQIDADTLEISIENPHTTKIKSTL